MDELEIATKLADHENRIKVSEHRISDLEGEQKQIMELTLSVHELATSVKTMTEQQKEHNERIKKLEMEPAENVKSAQKTVVSSIISTIVGLLIGALVAILAKGGF